MFMAHFASRCSASPFEEPRGEGRPSPVLSAAESRDLTVEQGVRGLVVGGHDPGSAVHWVARDDFASSASPETPN
jgi:hypothetical protein